MKKTNGNRSKLNAEQVVYIVKEWNQKSIEQLANDLEKSPSAIRNTVTAIRKEDPTKCPRKPRTKRVDVVREALKLLSAEDDVVTDK